MVAIHRELHLGILAQYTGLGMTADHIKMHALRHAVMGNCVLYTLHAFALSAPFTRHAKQRGFLFDDHTGEAS